MEQEFITIIEKMTTEQGVQVLLGGAWRKWLPDYVGSRCVKETKLFKQILEADSADHIDSADNVPERKQALLERLESDHGISPKAAAEYLDLLGMILKGDMSKCGTQSTPPAAAPQPPAPAAWHINRDGQKEGPFDRDGLAAKAARGEFGADTPVWKKGMSGWVAAGTVAELAAIIAEAPPPSPPEQAAPEDGDDPKALWKKGTAYLRQGEFDKALEVTSKALRLEISDSQKIILLNNRAYAYKRLGRIDDAVADLSEAVKIKPETSNNWECRALVYEEAGEYQKAIADCKKALELNPALEDNENEDRAKAILARCEAALKKAPAVPADGKAAFCDNCGSALHETLKFCPSCGAKVEK